MKKLISAILAVTMLVSLTACSKDEPTNVPMQIPGDVLQNSSFTPVVPEEQETQTITEEEAVAADRKTMEKLVKLTTVVCSYDDWEWDSDWWDYELDSNFSCYSDSAMTELHIIEDYGSSWRYNPTKLSKDGELYMPSGIMEGITITFFPEVTKDGTVFKIRDARVNEMVLGYYSNPKETKTTKFSEMHPEMCDFICDILGETLEVQSATYKYSSFTIFLNEDADDDYCYGSWNGTNLTNDMKYDVGALNNIVETTLNNEKVKFEKDNSATDELANAIRLALADNDVYDELMALCCTNNIATYLDTASESNYEQFRIVEKEAEGDSPEQYSFLLDGILFDSLDTYPTFSHVGGNMTGVTLTFEPELAFDGKICYDFGNAIVNKYIRDTSFYTVDRVAGAPRYKGDTPNYEECGVLRDILIPGKVYGGLYGKLRAVLGDRLYLSSDLAQHSEYTIFIGLSSDTVRVYGQWANTVN